MKQFTLAPWAEPVPDPPPNLTANDLLDLPDDGYTYELVEGRLVRVPGSGWQATTIAANMLTMLNMFVRSHKLGQVSGADGEFNLTQPGERQETALVPDVAFLRADRVPPRDSEEFKKAPRLAPDLAVEVASPNQFRPEMAAKARLYLARGVRLVWVVWPADRQVDVWRTGRDEPMATLGVNDQLDGLDILPGFTHPVADLFE
jgi:Uma2 family endonuclease